MSLLSWTAFAQMYRDGRDCKYVILEFKNGRSNYFVTEEEIQRVLEGIREQAETVPGFIPQKLANLANQLQEDKKYLAGLEERVNEAQSGEELAALFSEYWQTFRDTIFGMGIDLYFDDVLLKKLSDYLSESLHLSPDSPEFNEYLSAITSAVRLTTTQQEEIDFLQLLLDGGDFSAHLKKYSYLPMWFDNKPWEVADLERRSAQYKNKEEIEARLNQLKKEIPERIQAAEECLAKIKPSKEIEELIHQIQEFAYLRQEGEVQISLHNFAGIPLKKKIADLLGIDFQDIVFLTDTEIMTNLLHQDVHLDHMLKERREYCFMRMKLGEYEIFTGEAAHQERAKLQELLSAEKEVETTGSTLKGVIGSRGVAKGRVRVIHGLEEIPTMQAGEILVVSGTSVEYLAAMQLSSGIISEIGGITSHAAVISRELNKPCLTRVPNATKILRTGEIIELDAIQGEIRRQ